MNAREVQEHFGNLLDEEALRLILEDEKNPIVSEVPICELNEDYEGKNINIRGRILKLNGRRKAGNHDVATLFLKNGDSDIKLNLWDESIDLLEKLHAGYEVRVINGTVKKRNGEYEMELSRWGEIEIISRELLNYFFPLNRLPINERVNVVGAIIETPQVRAFIKKNNDIGVVGSTTLSDGANSVRVVSWDSATRYLKDLVRCDQVEILDARVRKKDALLELHCDEKTIVRKV